jgi:hypothetical protein
LNEVEMKTRKFGKAFRAAVVGAVALSAFSAGGIGRAAAEECTGPFRECAIGVQAQCTRDRDGQQRMTFWDYSGNAMGFEQCVGRIFERAGQANPYKTPTSGATSGSLTLPRIELLSPSNEP